MYLWPTLFSFIFPDHLTDNNQAVPDFSSRGQLFPVLLGMIQKLRNAVVAPTGMGKNYGRIMPLLRQGWLVRQKIMHYGFFGQCFSGCLCSQEETSQLQPILLFWKIPLGNIKKNFQYIHQQVLDKDVFGLKFLSFSCSRIT